MNTEGLILLGTMVVLFLTMLVFIWQTIVTRREIRKNAIRNIYERYLEINKLEVQYPILHRMFMDAKTADALRGLPEDEVRRRALSLLIFDQFALIYNLGERRSRWTRIDPLVRRVITGGLLRWWWDDFIDRKRTLLDINESYIRGIMSNPDVLKCWREYRLGETWKGSKYYEFVEGVIACRNADITAAYDSAAREYTEAFFNEATLNAELGYLGRFTSMVRNGGRVLDVGCGPGIETRFLQEAGLAYEGIDISPKMIEIAKARNPAATYRVMDMKHLEYPDGSFDGILSLESLIHLPRTDVQSVLEEFRRVMKAGGVLLLAMQRGRGDRLMPFTFDPRRTVLVNLFEGPKVRMMLSRLGFRVEYCTTRKPLAREFAFDKLVVIAIRRPQ